MFCLYKYSETREQILSNQKGFDRCCFSAYTIAANVPVEAIRFGKWNDKQRSIQVNMIILQLTIMP